MRLRTIALALALACGFSAASQAKKNVIHPAAKSHHVKRAHRYKRGRHVAKAAHRKVVQHR